MTFAVWIDALALSSGNSMRAHSAGDVGTCISARINPMSPRSPDTGETSQWSVSVCALSLARVLGGRCERATTSFCSLIQEGASVVEIAIQLGHSPTMTLDTYGNVFEGRLDGYALRATS
jgi:hypothetical protein